MEPIASPTRSDLLQKINEKKYRVNSDYLLREIAGEYAIIPNIHFSPPILYFLS